MGGLVTLESERLLLRGMTVKDRSAVVNLLQDGHVQKSTWSVPYPYTAEDFSSFLKYVEEGSRENTALVFLVVIKQSKEVIGEVSLKRHPFLKRLYLDKPYPVASLGYWIGKEFGGNGFCTEACKTLIDFAFQEEPSGWGLHKIEAEHIDFNTASGKVMAKVGMRREGVLREETWKDGVFRDTIRYGMLRKDWLAL